jgi:hypothetical protein
MSYGDDDADRLAYDLAHSDFDAVERGGLRAAWSDDGTLVTVEALAGKASDAALDGDPSVEYNAEDLVRAESDPEVRNARNPTPEDA